MSEEDSFKLLAAYEDGLQGYIDSPRDRGLFSESQKQSVYLEPNTAGSRAAGVAVAIHPGTRSSLVH